MKKYRIIASFDSFNAFEQAFLSTISRVQFVQNDHFGHLMVMLLQNNLPSFNPYPGFLGPSPSVFSGKKIQIHYWRRHSWDLKNKNYMNK